MTKKHLQFIAIIFTVYLSLAFTFIADVYPFEALKYIGEIAIEKGISSADFTIDASGNIYIADKASGKIIYYNKFGNLVKKLTTGKKIFSRGGAIDLDKEGNFLIVDTASNKILKLNKNFKELFVIGGTGASESQFRTPWGISIDANNNFYIADSGNKRIQVFNPDGIFFAKIKSGERESSSRQVKYKKRSSGFKGGAALTLPYLNKPIKVAVDEKGNIYVLDNGTYQVNVYTPQGDPKLVIYLKKYLKSAKLSLLDMVVGNDKIFVLTKENIKVFNADKGTFINNIGSKGKGRGQFMMPSAIELMDNIIYILDAGNRRVQIMEYGEKKWKPLTAEKTLEEKTKIAVFDFKDSNALSKRKQFGETVSEMFITSGVNTANFIVVERKEIRRILDELNFSRSDMIDVSTAKKVGKLLGIDYGIMGSVAVFDKSIEIDIRFIQLETGIIVLAESKRTTGEKNIRDAVDEVVHKIERIYVNRLGAPQAPSGFFVMGGIKSIYIRWDQNNEADISAYNIYRSDSPDGKYKLIKTVQSNEFTDKGLSEGVEYYYRLSAVDSNSNESSMSEVLKGKSREKPTFGYILKIKSRVLVKQCSFSWNKPDKEEITQYKVYRSDSESGEYVFIGSSRKSSYVDSGLNDGTEYYYRIKKVFRDGLESQFSNSFLCKTEARPQIPTGLNAGGGLARRIILTWNKSKIDRDISKYAVLRSEFPDTGFKMIKAVRSNKYTDTKLLDNKTYYYKLKAIDKYKLESDFSEVMNATTKDVPSSPKNVNAEGDLPRHILLIWDKNPEKDIAKYVIYRSLTHDGEFKKLCASKVNEFDNTKLPDYSEFFYFVTSIDKDHLESKPSETVVARTKPIPVTPANIKAISNQPGKITLLWNRNPEEDIKYYNILCSKKIKGRFKKIGDSEGNAFIYENLKDNITFFFKITAVDKDNLISSNSDIVSATTKPLPPKPLDVSAVVKNGKVILTWSTVAYEDLFGYVIYKNNKKIEIISQSSFTDNAVDAGKSAKYEITTIDNDKLESPKSQSVKIKMPK